MRSVKRLPLSAHAVVELTAGLALVVAALALTLTLPGVLALFCAGALLAGLGLAGLDDLPLATHERLDRLLVVGLSAASVALALHGDATAAAVLLGVAAGQLLLAATTRWSRPAYPSYGSAR